MEILVADGSQCPPALQSKCSMGKQNNATNKTTAYFWYNYYDSCLQQFFPTNRKASSVCREIWNWPPIKVRQKQSVCLETYSGELNKVYSWFYFSQNNSSIVFVLSPVKCFQYLCSNVSVFVKELWLSLAMISHIKYWFCVLWTGFVGPPVA